jgi:toxin ParE1/3/4
VQEVRTALRFVQNAPEMWPPKSCGMRRYLINRFPFVLHYRVESDLIRVVAIAHGRQKPGYWKTRI